MESEYKTMEDDGRSVKRLKCWLAAATTAAVGFAVALIVVLAMPSHDAPSGGGTVVPTGDDDVTFFHISDVHFDPFYDAAVSCTHFCRSTSLNFATTACGPKVLQRAEQAAPFGRYGCDAPLALLTSTLEQMVAVDPNPAFVLLTGDMAAHRLCGNATMTGPCTSPLANATAAQAAIQAVVDLVRATFPCVPVVPMFGNNDVPAHYVTPLGPLGKPWLDAMAALWRPAALSAGCPNELPADNIDMSIFSSTGAYSVLLGPSPGFRVVALNTLLFGRLEKYNLSESGGIATQRAAADSMKVWLESTLATAGTKGEKVILASHMPPGMQPYDDQAVWDEGYSDGYVEQVSAHADAVVAQLYGHFHYDTFRVLDDGKAGAVLLTPSISPVNRNNPAFRRMFARKADLSVYDYEQYWLDLPQSNALNKEHWALQYKFSQLYNTTLAGKDMAALQKRLALDTRLYSEYMQNRQIMYSPFQQHVSVLHYLLLRPAPPRPALSDGVVVFRSTRAPCLRSTATTTPRAAPTLPCSSSSRNANRAPRPPMVAQCNIDVAQLPLLPSREQPAGRNRQGICCRAAAARAGTNALCGRVTASFRLGGGGGPDGKGAETTGTKENRIALNVCILFCISVECCYSQ